MTLIESTEATATLVAVFGTAELVQVSQGRLALRGGTANDFTEAKEWVSMFMPESILRQPQSRNDQPFLPAHFLRYVESRRIFLAEFFRTKPGASQWPNAS